MGNWTPGPWLAEVSPDGRGLSFVEIPHSDADGEILCSIVNPDNARLIAAAPDLYEACTALLGAWGAGEEAFSRLAVATGLAREAVAKANGS